MEKVAIEKLSVLYVKKEVHRDVMFLRFFSEEEHYKYSLVLRKKEECWKPVGVKHLFFFEVCPYCSSSLNDYCTGFQTWLDPLLEKLKTHPSLRLRCLFE